MDSLAARNRARIASTTYVIGKNKKMNSNDEKTIQTIKFLFFQRSEISEKVSEIHSLKAL